MKRTLLAFTLPLLLASFQLGCSDDDDEKPKDTGSGVLDQGATPDTIGVIEAMGKLCTNIGLQCKEKHMGGELFKPNGLVMWCVALQGGGTGQGFCTPTCSDQGNECFGVPNGQMASCFIEAQAAVDGGTGTKYCGFLCKADGKTWTCPGELKCGKPNAQGQAVCLQ